MEIIETKLLDCLIIKPKLFEDERGFFMETFQANRYLDCANIHSSFVQDNHSYSSKNVLRGLHYQRNQPQGKLVRVVQGEVFDVAVDLRKDSPTYGQWESIVLSEKNKLQFWVPPGFAHGFLVLSESADFLYKCTSFYKPEDEGCIVWNDPDLNIEWPIRSPILSRKDSEGSFFKDLDL